MKSQNLEEIINKIILGGFSQGAALNLYTALEHPKELGAVISMSGHQLYKDVSCINEDKKSLPIFAYHGEMDPVLNYQLASPFYSQMKEAGFSIQVGSEEYLAHSLSMTEIRLAKEFLESNLA